MSLGIQMGFLVLVLVLCGAEGGDGDLLANINRSILLVALSSCLPSSVKARGPTRSDYP